MRIICSFATLLLFSLFFFGCATGSDRLLQVGPGMSPAQVQESLGSPDDKTFQGKQERWVYKGSGDKGKLVVFENGKVVELINVDNTAKSLHIGSEVKDRNPADRMKYCAGDNPYGKYPEGGGCNMYGCWPAGGYCNGFGCTTTGRCTVEGCPNKISSYQCLE